MPHVQLSQGQAGRQTANIKAHPLQRACCAVLGAIILLVSLSSRAAIPAAANLLPPDTLFLLSVPDWDKAAAYSKGSAYGKLWQDPALKAFKDQLMERWTEEFAGSLERNLGIKLTDYLDLLHGQVTFAMTQNGWGSRAEARPAFILLFDSKDSADALKTRLEAVRRKCVDAGKHLKLEKIRDIEFTTLLVSDEELSKALAVPTGEADKESDEPKSQGLPAGNSEKTAITFGQSGSLLIVGNNIPLIERVMARQAGSLGAGLNEQAAYEANHNALFRDALAIVWLNFAQAYEAFTKQFGASKPNAAGNPFAPTQDKLLSALGLGSVKTVAGRLQGADEGLSAEVFVNVPDSRRQGLFRLLVAERREAGPPPFVTTDVMKFKRWRMDGQKAWETVERILVSVSPEISGLLQLGLQAAGKDRDPNFDLRKALVGNLGNDFISLVKAPRAANLTDEPASLFLIGSANPEQLVQGVKVATALMPLATGSMPEIKEREFLGRKIYSVPVPAGPAGDEIGGGAPAPHDFSFAAAGGYAAMSSDTALVETYLRSADTSGKPLRETAGFKEAAEKVGGMGTGFFGYENQVETIRLWLESAKKENAALEKLLSLAPLAGGKAITPEERKKMKSWLDASLLPPFEKISKYFYFFVYSVNSNDQGLSWKWFAPTAPTLRAP